MERILLGKLAKMKIQNSKGASFGLLHLNRILNKCLAKLERNLARPEDQAAFRQRRTRTHIVLYGCGGEGAEEGAADGPKHKGNAFCTLALLFQRLVEDGLGDKLYYMPGRPPCVARGPAVAHSR